MTSPLAGGTAVVTGGAGQASGLGRGLVTRLAAAGMRVAVLDVDGAAAAGLAAALRDEGHDALALTADVRVPESLQEAAAAVDRAFGGCSVLCAHVGGGGGQGRFVDLPLGAWAEAVELMVTGTVATVQAFLPLLRATSGRRRIVLTSSVAALAPGRFQGPYRAAKAAVLSIGETLDLELGPEGIGTTVAFPSGMVPPELVDLARQAGRTTPEPGDLTGAIAAELCPDPADVEVGEAAAVPVVEAVVAEQRYVITHGRTVEAGYRARQANLDEAFAELAGRAYRSTAAR